MTVEAVPLGVRCNLRCSYCYENPIRDNAKGFVRPDYVKIKTEIQKHGQAFTLFGGEPLLLPISRLEELWKFGFENYRVNGCQTNGSLITGKHIELFKQYAVQVGFSIDGPGELNDARLAPSGSLSATRFLTAKSLRNLERLLEEKVTCSLIITLHNLNASRDRLPKLIEWLKKLNEKGLIHVRLHLLENDDADNLTLSDEETVAALIELEGFEPTTTLQFDLFREFKERLRTGNGGTCVFQECDPLSTTAVQGIGPKGEPLNCGRVNKHGVDYLKSARTESTRSLVLLNTPQEHGGCKGCEYWYACKGNCPGTGEGGDWRNRTAHCAVLKKFFQYLCERHGISLVPPEQQVKLMVRAAGKHGDHYDDGHGDATIHADAPHQDIAHIDIVHLPRLEVRRAS